MGGCLAPDQHHTPRVRRTWKLAPGTPLDRQRDTRDDNSRGWREVGNKTDRAKHATEALPLTTSTVASTNRPSRVYKEVGITVPYTTNYKRDFSWLLCCTYHFFANAPVYVDRFQSYTDACVLR